MTRDMDLIRALLLQLEAMEKRPSDVMHIVPDDDTLAIEGYTVEQVEHHLSLIHEAGFLDHVGGGQPMEGIMFRRLSWQGYEFLDTLRDPAVWRTTKDKASKVGGAGLGIILDIGKAVIRGELAKHGLPLG